MRQAELWSLLDPSLAEAAYNVARNVHGQDEALKGAVVRWFDAAGHAIGQDGWGQTEARRQADDDTLFHALPTEELDSDALAIRDRFGLGIDEHRLAALLTGGPETDAAMAAFAALRVRPAAPRGFLGPSWSHQLGTRLSAHLATQDGSPAPLLPLRIGASLLLRQLRGVDLFGVEPTSHNAEIYTSAAFFSSGHRLYAFAGNLGGDRYAVWTGPGVSGAPVVFIGDGEIGVCARSVDEWARHVLTERLWCLGWEDRHVEDDEAESLEAARASFQERGAVVTRPAALEASEYPDFLATLRAYA